MNNSIEIEVYKNIFETWRFQVDSYWQRNNYFAAFETAAIAGCWYLLEHQKTRIGLLFTLLGAGLTVVWFWSNIAVHRYTVYWWESVKVAERVLSMHNTSLDVHPFRDNESSFKQG